MTPIKKEKKLTLQSSFHTGLTYLLLAQGIFLCACIEGIYGYLLEPLLFDTFINDAGTIQSIIHWVITCISWGVFIMIFLRTAQKRCNFQILETSKPLTFVQIFLVLFSIIFCLILSYMDWHGFKILLEYKHRGALLFIFQYVYYMFETMIFSLIIIFAQKAFECWFSIKNIPYGGIITALTWGLIHILTKGSLYAGIFCAIKGFLFGATYLNMNRNIKKAYPVLFLMFVL
ncbi:hypothetical protein [Anaerocolumna sp. MB42-C2]|uniref:hypothetical protein n=1 Tax=Anaerocolumna sp. MB42-C2 TaxID=3070997 RepID=UPI0027E203F4|nr:hypothetical protein [Anaerocolumna sp. MB42-C2]WMJ88010.1 hypothetical protein RBU59_00465 [Anaerocolumna sp. MB42-C2]